MQWILFIYQSVLKLTWKHKKSDCEIPKDYWLDFLSPLSFLDEYAYQWWTLTPPQRLAFHILTYVSVAFISGLGGGLFMGSLVNLMFYSIFEYLTELGNRLAAQCYIFYQNDQVAKHFNSTFSNVSCQLKRLQEQVDQMQDNAVALEFEAPCPRIQVEPIGALDNQLVQDEIQALIDASTVFRTQHEALIAQGFFRQTPIGASLEPNFQSPTREAY
jgi:hypothetical protein